MMPWWRNWLDSSSWPLGRRVTMAVIAVTLACLAIGGVILDRAVAAGLKREAEAALAAAASALIDRCQQSADGSWIFTGIPDFARSARPDVWELHGPDGTLMGCSATRVGKPPLPVEVPSRSRSRPRAVWCRLDGETMLLSTWRKDGSGPWVTVARECEDIEEMLVAFRLILLGVGVAVAIAAAVAILVTVRRGLRPLDDLGRRIADLDGERLDQRITMEAVPVDIRPVIDRLNDLLARLDAAFVRERAFSADVAHELRNPLGAMRLDLESTLMGLAAESPVRPCVANAHQACLHLHDLVERLLALARLDAGQAAGPSAEVDASAMLNSAWMERCDDAERRGISGERDMPGPVPVRCDPDALRAVLRNLIDNAIEHPDAGSRVRMMVARHVDQSVVLRIANTGCHLQPGDAERVCDRLWRGDPGRGGTGRHHGLGLALCRRLVQAMGGTLAITIADGEFTVALTLPAAAVRAGDRPVPPAGN